MSDDPVNSPELARYSRQMLFAPLGVEGQRRLKHASVVLIGCGALGSALSNLLVRAGVGALRIIDRDFVELSDLQRQTLFDEHDIAQNLPKAVAAVRKLHKINSAVEVEGLVADLHPENAAALCADADLLLDGTDNLETRYLINDVAVQGGVPWVFGACLGATGLVMPIVPHQGPCLRCLWEEPPQPGAVPTCDTAGILAATVNVVASLQATEAMKLLIGPDPRSSGIPAPSNGALPVNVGTSAAPTARLTGRLLSVDVWAGRVRALNVWPAFAEGDCPCCRKGRFDFLAGDRVASTTTLCGRDAVQVRPSSDAAGAERINLRSLAACLPPQADAKFNEFLLRFRVDCYHVAVFTDGRAIVRGTSDPVLARSIYAKYIGT